MVLLQIMPPSCLPLVQLLWCAEVRKVKIVCDDLNRVRCTIEILVELLKTLYNGKKFPVIDLIVPSCCIE